MRDGQADAVPAGDRAGPRAGALRGGGGAGLVAGEALFGVCIGLIAMLPLAGLSLGGYIMGHQMGLAIAESFDPETNANASVLGQCLFILGVYVFLAAGGLDALFVGITDSFDRLPVGAAGLADAPLDLFVGVLVSSWEIAIRLASPVLAVVFMVLIAMGVIMKTMPQINILTIGFAIKIMIGLAVLGASLVAIEETIAGELRRVFEQLLWWAQAG